MSESHVLVVCRDEVPDLTNLLPPSIIAMLRDKLGQDGLRNSTTIKSTLIADPFLSVRIDGKDAAIVAGVRHAVFKAGYTLGLGRLPQTSSPEKRLCFFDMDATLVAEESIVELARAAGKSKEVEEITRDAMAGRVDFRQAFEARLQLLKGLPRAALPAVVSSMTLNRGIEDFSRLAFSRGIKSYLVSGGFNAFADPLARKLQFTKSFAHELIFDGDEFSGRIAGEIIDAERKALIVQQEAARASCDLSDVIAIGDGANDLRMMEVAGLAVGFQPKQVLLPVLDAANFRGDHRFMIHLLALAD